MKRNKTTEMWENALEKIDEKYIAEAANAAPAGENSDLRGTISKGGTGNLGFALAAAAAVIVSFIGVGFFLKGTGIEPLSPSSGSIGASNTEENNASVTDISGNGNMTTTIIMNENGEITTVVSKSENTTAIEPISQERYEEWFAEAEKIKEGYLAQIEETEKAIAECEERIAVLEKKLETEELEQKGDYDNIKEDIAEEITKLAHLKNELEQLKKDYSDQISLIEMKRKAYEELYPTAAETKEPLTMEKLKALVAEKGKELTWGDFEQFEGTDIGSGLFIMEYPIDEIFTLVVGGVPTVKPMYIKLVCNADNSSFSISDNGSEGFEEFVEGISPFALLGDYYEGQDGLFHVSGESWTVCEDYDLFREYFFGVWGEDFVIDDSEKDWVAASRSMYFDNFYKVSDNVLAIVYHGFAGGELRWLDMRNPHVLYEAYGGIGDFPAGFPKNEDGTPIVFAKKKTSSVTNEPQNGYLSIYRLKELSKEYGIPLENLTDIEIQAEKGALYHDSKYHFYPMYLTFESDNRLVINTEARLPYGDGELFSLVFEKFTGKWERTMDYRWEDPTILKGNLYSEKEMPSELIIPEGITEISEGVFMGCTQLEKVTLPSTLKIIGKDAFKNCTNLKEITIPYGVTEIGERAFENCTSLPADFSLPDTVTTIGDGAFAGCTRFDGTFKPAAEAFALIRPVDGTEINTDYGENAHDGIDYASEIGDNVYAAAIGTVSLAGWNSGYGLCVIIDHGNGFSTLYAHMDSVSVKEGDAVSAGDVIGYVGVTGWTTGPHLHFTLYKDGETLDPADYIVG